LICERLLLHWTFCSSLHTHGHYTKQKPHTAPRSPKVPWTVFRISVGISQITTIVLRLLKMIFFLR
jgi:hypothetical protein